jgi:hypothetical protein
MTPKLTRVFIGLCIVLTLFFLLRSCAADAKLQEAKLRYEGYRAIAIADHEMSMRRVAALTTEIGSLTNEIELVETQLVQKTLQLEAVSSQLDDLQNAEPVQPELESQPLVINLRAQVAKVTEMFHLSQEVVESQRGEIILWERKYEAQVSISEEWKGAYEREHSLRIRSEELFILCEHRVKMNGFWGTVRGAAVGAVAGLLVGGLIK